MGENRLSNNKWIDYYSGKKENKNWIISEREFNPFNQGKFESIFSIGNGYIGSRASLDEEYPNRHVGFYVSSTFNKVQGPEVDELPNAANIWDFSIKLNGEKFNMLTGSVGSYERKLNLKNGELTRSLDWKSNLNDEMNLQFNKFVSLDNLHLMAQKLVIEVKQDSNLEIESGINGQVSNSGAQHFEDSDSTYIDSILEYIFTTTESKIDFVWNKIINIYVNDKLIKKEPKISSVYGYLRRCLNEINSIDVKKGDIVTFEVITTLNTTRDIEYENNKIFVKDLRLNSKKNINKLRTSRYSELLLSNNIEWNNWWVDMEIKIDTDQNWDIISTRFSQYHIRRFTPIHDWRANIEAKGFSGEEYKGHTFWDTEIFIWPYFLYTKPSIARNLVKHRFFVRNSAYIKAKENGEKGMMWPWETTWPDKGEACPTWGAVDRKEGTRIKVWPAYNQLHIGACITWSIYQYFVATKDNEFMDKYGYEVFFETAKFWVNRLEYNESLDRYEITKVTGPNEYKENINNNAWTNYMVWYNLTKSLEYISTIKNSDVYSKLNKKINLVNLEKKIKKIVHKIYLPQPNKDGIIPENDSFLKLDQIDTLFYKKNPDQLWKDYTFPELNQYQVLKQADVVALMYTLGFLFDSETIQKNWKYYEDRTFHHSSLSLSMHTITANYSKDKTFAYDFFLKATEIDLGTDMSSCDNGIHSASIGGVLQSIIIGFGGIMNQNGKLTLSPNLPLKWNSLNFDFYFEGEKITVNLTKKLLSLFKENNGKDINFIFKGEAHSLVHEVKLVI